MFFPSPWSSVPLLFSVSCWVCRSNLWQIYSAQRAAFASNWILKEKRKQERMKKMTPETTKALHICRTAAYEETCREKRPITVWQNHVEILQSKDQIKDEYNNTAVIQDRQTPQASQQQDTSALLENGGLGLFENSCLIHFKRTACVGVNLKSMACFSFSRNLECEWHF